MASLIFELVLKPCRLALGTFCKEHAFLRVDSMKRKILLLSAAGLLALTPIVLAQTSLFNPQQVIQAQGNGEMPISPTPINALPTQPVHPSEPISDTLNDRFSLDNSLMRIDQIDEALVSFRQLTETSQANLREQLSAVGNTDWETQNLGFHNWVNSIEGTLKQQDLQIKQLELELAQKQFEDGEITQAQLDAKTANHQKSVEAFQSFWNSFNIAD